MKKLLAILLAVAMLFAFASCGGKDNGETTTAANGENNETINAQDVVDKALEEAEEHESLC